MRNKFKGFYTLTDKQISKIWETGFISLDTNVLFNLYRYSDDTRKELLQNIEKYSEKIWLPYHVAYEFHKNRISVISEQIKIYDETIKDFEKIENNIVKNLKSPHLSKPIQEKFEKYVLEVKKDLEKRSKFYLGLLKKDTILTKITKIFDKKIGDEWSKEEITKIEKEGEDRYKRKIPPGFKDNSKEENKFGDLLIWKELIKNSKDTNQPFIFLIDDVKEDWWVKTQGLTLAPRPELSQELYTIAKQQFYMYTPDRFLEYSAVGGEANNDAIEEVRNIQNTSPYYSASQFPTQFDSENLIWRENQFIAQPSSLLDIYQTGSLYGNINPYHTNSIYGNLDHRLGAVSHLGSFFIPQPVRLATLNVPPKIIVSKPESTKEGDTESNSEHSA